ncbi:MAG: hypothetical protein MK212_11860 [Saprospiraceae bacterium]|nr:hypothetical protein [Saprospiraceae bacterium]
MNSMIKIIVIVIVLLVLNACSQQVISDALLQECKEEYKIQQDILQQLEEVDSFYSYKMKKYIREHEHSPRKEKLLDFLDTSTMHHAEIINYINPIVAALDKQAPEQLQKLLSSQKLNDLVRYIHYTHQRTENHYLELPSPRDLTRDEVVFFKKRMREEINMYLDDLSRINSSDIEKTTVIETKLLLNSILVWAYNLKLVYLGYVPLYIKTGCGPGSYYPTHNQLEPLNPKRGESFQAENFVVYQNNYEFVENGTLDLRINGDKWNVPVSDLPLDGGKKTFAKKDLAKIQNLVIEAEYTDRWERTNILKDTFYYQTCTN